MSKEKLKHLKECPSTNFNIRPNSMLYLYVNKKNSSVLEQLTTKRFSANSRYFIFKNISGIYELVYLPKHLNNVKSNMNSVN
jgi:hypothetical protein